VDKILLTFLGGMVMIGIFILLIDMAHKVLNYFRDIPENHGGFWFFAGLITFMFLVDYFFLLFGIDLNEFFPTGFFLTGF